MDDIKFSDKELVEITGEKVIGTPSGLDAQCAQAELTRRLMESIKQLERSNNRYSDRMLELTILLFIIGFVQIVISIRTVVSTPIQWVMAVVIFAFFIYWTIRQVRIKNK